jgi:antitoxin MazE
MKVAKWGNSLAVRLPQAVVDVLDLKEGDEIEINVSDKGSVELGRKLSRKELFDRIQKLRGTLPKDFKFDRMEANRRGG